MPFLDFAFIEMTRLRHVEMYAIEMPNVSEIVLRYLPLIQHSYNLKMTRNAYRMK